MARRRVVSLVAGGLLALAAALVATPGTATAHNSSASLQCSPQHSPVLSINLTNYSYPYGSNHNTVSASIDGSSVLATTNFNTSYSHSFSAGSAFTSHTAQVVVHAWDDPTGSHGWTKTFNLSAGACLRATPSPTTIVNPTPTPTPTPTEAPTATPFETFQGETGTPVVTGPPCVVGVGPDAFTTLPPCATPFESFQGETAFPSQDPTPPSTSTGGDGSSGTSTPLFALFLGFAFGGLGLITAQAQRRSIRRR